MTVTLVHKILLYINTPTSLFQISKTYEDSKFSNLLKAARQVFFFSKKCWETSWQIKNDIKINNAY